MPNLEAFIGRIQASIAKLDFEGKRLALDMLNITVWLDGENIEVTRIIEPEKAVAHCVSNQNDMSNVTPIPFNFKLSAGVV